ncbi:MAG: signal recognition particle protein [Chloroflexota bacterium]
MFENLTERFDTIFQQLRRRGKLSTADVDSAMREVRLALLEADVHYSVVKDFVARVRERAVGVELARAITPGQQVIKIVHEELIATLGNPVPLITAVLRPVVIMLVGLQGSGKTTTAAKLARLLQSDGERVLLVAADPYRPAASDQLQVLGERINVPVFVRTDLEPPELVKRAYELALRQGLSILILDTAGRSQLDEDMMRELRAIAERIPCEETLLVLDAMTGQEALNIAEGFRRAVKVTGLILAKMDGDARGGAAISIRSVTGIPIKLLGTGEGIEALEVYDPSRLASRILGMGDVIGLIERAERALDKQNAQRQAEKMLGGEFTLEDFAEQLRMVRRMGLIGQVLEMMLPRQMGPMAKMASPQEAEKRLKKTEAIINSMTIEERRKPKLLNASRRRRIAKGSGSQVQDVNRLIMEYNEMRKLIKRMQKSGLNSLLSRLG